MQSNPKETKQLLTHSTEEQGGKNAELLKRDLQLLQRDKQPQRDSKRLQGHNTTQITPNYFKELQVTKTKMSTKRHKITDHKKILYYNYIILLLYKDVKRQKKHRLKMTARRQNITRKTLMIIKKQNDHVSQYAELLQIEAQLLQHNTTTLKRLKTTTRRCKMTTNWQKQSQWDVILLHTYTAFLQS